MTAFLELLPHPPGILDVSALTGFVTPADQDNEGLLVQQGKIDAAAVFLGTGAVQLGELLAQLLFQFRSGQGDALAAVLHGAAHGGKVSLFLKDGPAPALFLDLEAGQPLTDISQQPSCWATASEARLSALSRTAWQRRR